jgi:hypothetical protein
MSTFITTLDTTGTGLRLAVKDLIDVAGVPTTAGSPMLHLLPALADPSRIAGRPAGIAGGVRSGSSSGSISARSDAPPRGGVWVVSFPARSGRGWAFPWASGARRR